MYINNRYADRKFYRFHKETLHSMCFFRRETIRRLEAVINSEEDPADFVLKFIRDNEPLYDRLPKPRAYFSFKKYFKSRLLEVRQWVDACQRRVDRKANKK